MNKSPMHPVPDDRNANEPHAVPTPEAASEPATAVNQDEPGIPIVEEQETPSIIIGVGEGTGDLPQGEPTLRAAKRCDVGARERNEDSCLIFSSEAGGHFTMMPFGLYIVADGMGGHTNGHVASRIASRVAARYVLTKIYMPLLQGDGPPTQAPIREVIIDAVQAANTAVFEDEPEIDSGTTLTLALVLGRRLHVAHVGDSRLYLFADGQLEAITNDHSLVQRLQDVGSLTPEEAAIYRYRNVLLRAVGQGEEVEIDTYTRLLPREGKLLLCSDGLCGFVSDTALQRIVDQDRSPQEIVDELYEAAMAEHSNDNITAVLVDFSL